MKSLILAVYLFTVPAFGAWPTQNFDDMIREHAKWERVDWADAGSDILMMGLMVAPTAIAIDQGRSWQEVGGVLAGQAATALVTDLGKRYFKRLRPDGSDKRSHPSGHSSAAFAGAAISCKLESKYCVPGYSAAAMAGGLRIAADKHWASDVAAGAAVGGLIGWYLPAVVWGF